MRTKKILSILLAMIMCMGTFGIIGVFAEEEQEVSFGQGAKGWDGVVNIAEDIAAAGGVDSAVILWEAFLCANHRIPVCSDPACAGANRSFYAMYNSKDAVVTWEAYRVQNNGDSSTTEPINIKDSADLASNTTGAHWEVTNYASENKTDVKLVIKQVLGSERYSWVRVRLGVKVGAAAVEYSAPIWVQLRDPGPLAKEILRCYDELAKTDRYTDAFLRNLRDVTKKAEAKVNTKITQSELDGWVKTLENARMGLDADGKFKAKIYKLFGWDWLDNLIPDSILKWFYVIKDVVLPMFDFIGQIGKALGYLLPLFSILGSLLGL